jgi:hypothetical protein
MAPFNDLLDAWAEILDQRKAASKQILPKKLKNLGSFEEEKRRSGLIHNQRIILMREKFLAKEKLELI